MLLLSLVWSGFREAGQVVAWSRWRRAHQCRKRACHYRARGGRPTT